jgi:hypothetical protein
LFGKITEKRPVGDVDAFSAEGNACVGHTSPEPSLSGSVSVPSASSRVGEVAVEGVDGEIDVGGVARTGEAFVAIFPDEALRGADRIAVALVVRSRFGRRIEVLNADLIGLRNSILFQVALDAQVVPAGVLVITGPSSRVSSRANTAKPPLSSSDDLFVFDSPVL